MKNKISLIILLSIFSIFSISLAAEGEPTQTGSNNSENTQNTTNPENTQNNGNTNENKVESLENEISKIEVSGTNKINIFLDKYENFPNNYVSGEFKILKELKVISNEKTSPKVVKISLSDPLEKNSSYNILDINGNGSIDINTSDNLENTTIKNADLSESSIESVKIINPTNIEINFKNDVNTQDFAFKVFELMKVSSAKGYNTDSGNYIELELSKNLQDNQNYILTILELKNSRGNKIEFTDNGYKEFSTTPIEETNPQTLENNTIEDPQTANTAMQTEQTPDTGTATNVLLILTFILSTIYFVYSRKKV